MVGGEVGKMVRTGKACSRATYVEGMENTHAYPVQLVLVERTLWEWDDYGDCTGVLGVKTKWTTYAEREMGNLNTRSTRR